MPARGPAAAVAVVVVVCSCQVVARRQREAEAVRTGRDAGGLPGAPCCFALRLQATADRPPPIDVEKKLAAQPPAGSLFLRRRSGHISPSTSLGHSAGAGRPLQTNRPCFQHRLATHEKGTAAAWRIEGCWSSGAMA